MRIFFIASTILLLSGPVAAQVPLPPVPPLG